MDIEKTQKEYLDRLYEESIREIDDTVALYKTQIKEQMEMFRRKRIALLEKELKQ